MMEIDISRALLRRDGVSGHYKYEGFPQYEGVTFIQPVRLTADYDAVEGGIRIKGSFETVVQTPCTRCLDDIDYPISFSFDEVFTKGEGEEDSYSYSGESISLDKMVYDAIVLEIPQSVLCSEECKGLCPQCGSNLNHAGCGCDSQETVSEANPFHKLKDLF